MKATEADVRAQIRILGSLLLEPGGFDSCHDVIRASDFSLPRHRQILEALIKCISEGVPAEKLTDEVAQELVKAGGDFLATYSELVRLYDGVSATSTIRHDCEQLAASAQLRRLAYQAVRLQKAAESRDFDAAREILTGIHDLAVGPAGADDVTLTEAARLHAQLLADLKDKKRKLYRTGLAVFDEDIGKTLGGGIPTSTLGLIGGRTASGKTTLCVYTALQIARRHPGTRIHVFSLELHPRDIAAKAIANEAFYQNLPEGIARHERAAQAVEHLAKGIGDRITISEEVAPSAILAKAHRRAREGVDVFVLDHVHRIKAPSDPKLLRHILGEFAKGIRDHAKRFDVPWLVASQLNRDSVKAGRGRAVKPGLGDLSESDKIGQEADYCVNLWYPNPEDRVRCSVDVVKNRTGPETSRPMIAHWKRQGFTDDKSAPAR